MKKIICDEGGNVDHVMVVGILVLDYVIFLLTEVSLHGGSWLNGSHCLLRRKGVSVNALGLQ